MANSYPASGQVILDDLKVCTNARLQPHFVSYGEHMFMNLESAHNNSYLPVISFLRAGCAYGSIGLNRASNSDSLGSYTESEMIIGTQTNVPTSLTTNGQRRLIISNDGRVGVGVSPSSDFHIKGPSAAGCPFGAELRVWENSFGAVMQGSTLGTTYAFFGNFRYNFATPSSSDAIYSGSAGGLLFKDGIHMFTSNPGASTFTPSERLTIDNSGNVGMGVTSPNTRLHILTSGTSNYTAGANRGLLITSDAGARLILENPAATVCNNHRAWTMKNDFGRLSFGLLTDSGAAWVNENILTMVCAGNVGIGSVAPDSKLHISNTVAGGTNNYSLIIQNICTVSDARAGIAFSNNDQTPSAGGLSGASIQTSNNGIDGTGNLLFGTLLSGTNTERMRISHNGNIGISCTSPGSKLTVGGTLTTTDTITTTSGTVNTIISWNSVVGIVGTDTNHGLQIRTCGTERIRITCNGEIGINTSSPGSYKLYVNGSFYSAGSSCEYKQSICQYNTDSCMFMKLKPVTYQYKDEWCHLGKELKSGTQIGLIAEDTAEVFPELAILKDEEEQKVVRNVDYEKLSIILLSEVQKLRKEVDNLKNNK